MKLRMYLRGLGIGLLAAVLILSVNNKESAEKMSDNEIIARAKELGLVEKKATLADEITAENDVSDESYDKTDIDDKPDAPAAEPAKPNTSSSSTEKKEDKTETKKPNTSSSAKIDTDAKESTANEIKSNSSTDTGSKPSSTTKVKEDKTEPAKPDTSSSSTEKKEDKTEPKKPNTSSSSTEKKEDKAETDTQALTRTKSRTTITVSSGISSETVAKLLEKGGAIDSAASFDKFLCDNNYDNRISTGTHEIPEGATYEEIAKILTSSK